jgi:hypothetical protein
MVTLVSVDLVKLWPDSFVPAVRVITAPLIVDDSERVVELEFLTKYVPLLESPEIAVLPAATRYLTLSPSAKGCPPEIVIVPLAATPEEFAKKLLEM